MLESERVQKQALIEMQVPLGCPVLLACPAWRAAQHKLNRACTARSFALQKRERAELQYQLHMAQTALLSTRKDLQRLQEASSQPHMCFPQFSCTDVDALPAN